MKIYRHISRHLLYFFICHLNNFKPCADSYLPSSVNGSVNCVASFAHFAAFSFIGCANYELFLFFFALFLALWYTCLAVQPIVVQQKRRKNQISNTAPTTFAVRKVKVKSRREEGGAGNRRGGRGGWASRQPRNTYCQSKLQAIKRRKLKFCGRRS